jgi:cold shock protein
MRNGTLKWLDSTKGYGFITPTDGGEDIFVRHEALQSAGLGDAEPGASLNFTVSRMDDGLQAIDITSAG